MKSRRFSTILGILLLMMFAGRMIVLAEDLPFSVKTELDKDSLTVGENLKVTVTVSTEKDVQVEFPDTDIDKGDFTLKDFGQKEKQILGHKKITRWYYFNTFRVGEACLPKLVIRYKRKTDKDWLQYQIPEHSLEVKSLLKDPAAEGGLRDIKPLLQMPSRFSWLWIVILLIFAAACFFAYRHFKQKKSVAPIASPQRLRPAHEIAYEQLEALQRKELVKQGRIKEYFIGISDIIRHYLENRFRFRAPEMTTEEFLINVRDSSPLIKTHKDLLKDFLVSCDMVKFAKYLPREEEIQAVYQTARNFIDQTKEEA